MKYSFALILLFAVLIGNLIAGEETSKRIAFEPGKSEISLTGKVTGRDSVLYKLTAHKGQWLEVEILPASKNGVADFNLYIPSRGPGDESLFNSLVSGRKFAGELSATGDYSIDAFLNRASARRGKTVNYKLFVRLTDQKPVQEEKPATGPVPQKVINDCLAELKKQIPDRKMKVISAKRGETSYIIDVEVEGVPNPWRCYHDGTRCTGTEYQGEG